MSSNVPAMTSQAVAGSPVVEVGRLESQDRPSRRLAGIGGERLVSALSPIILLAAWELFARLGVIDTRFFPAPTSILAVLWQMLQPTDQYPYGELWYQLSASLGRIALGFLIGAVPGVIVGLAMGLFRPVRAIIQPLIDATFPIPKIAVLPLFIMIFWHRRAEQVRHHRDRGHLSGADQHRLRRAQHRPDLSRRGEELSRQ
jgi:NitT/TauT family transport system permease protein